MKLGNPILSGYLLYILFYVVLYCRGVMNE